MGARSKTGRSRRLERWQVLLAAVVAAVGTIVAALLASSSSGGPAGSSSGGQVNVAITGLSEQPYPPSPGRLYRWSGTVRNLEPDASIFVIAKRPSAQAASPEGQGSGAWLVSPPAVVLINGRWTVTWIIREPPPVAQWTAVVWIQLPQAPPPPTGEPTESPLPPGFDLSSQGPHAPEVQAATTYHPRSTH
jgi:hypothetical protein